MSKICIIGEKQFIYGFKGVGISIFPVKNEKEAEESLKKALREKFSIVYLMEDYLQDMEKIEKMSKDLSVTIIAIPGRKKGKNPGWMRLKKMVEEATGVDLLKE